MNNHPNNVGCCRITGSGCRKNTGKKLAVYDWLCDVLETKSDTDFVEVQFKNTRKGYYLNSNKLPIEKGDIVAVEASPGHDIGEVTLTGRLVARQMKKYNVNPERDVRRVYRKARQIDLEKYEEAKAREQQTMIRARQIAVELGLNMKIGDVEYQGDGNKAIFYYIADERVDFRQLIKVLADTFKIRIEMRQIGARQEAGRIGGIGPCGRELCCSTWVTNFVSVSTSAARVQDISLNPQKLAGQCAKLKCCMNYELDTYLDAMKDFPPKDTVLETADGSWYHFKTDVFKREMSYSSAPNMAANITVLSVDRVKQIITLNKEGKRPEKLDTSKGTTQEVAVDYQNVVGQDSLTRFDRKKNDSNRSRNHNNNQGQNRSNNNKRNNNNNRNHNNNDRPIILKKKNDLNNESNS